MRSFFFLGLLVNFLFLPFWTQAQIINVDAAPYNAVGDGVTDDHDAIQNAIWDFKSTGGTLQFTSGKTYIISKGLSFNTFPDTHDYLVTTTGEAKATIKVQDGAPLTWNHWGIRLSESNNVTIRNLIIDGNRATRNPLQEYSGVDALFIDGASNGTRLENLELINSPADNLYIVVHTNQNQTMMTDFEMHNCKLDNAYRNNMSVISGANFKIIGCEFTHANGTAPEAGIDFEPNEDSPTYSNMLVEGCLFKDNANFGLMLTYIVTGAGTSTIKDNVFDNNGLLVASKDNSIHHNIFVNRDHFHHSGDDPNDLRDGIIYFHTGHTATGNEVHDNYFYDNNMPDGAHLIHFMYNCGGGNHVHDNYGHGNTVAGFVSNSTDPDTQPGQTIENNVFLVNREMGFWNMDADEIAGNVINDLSDFNHDGTITDATSVAGVENEALDFAPDNRYVAVSANDNLNIEMNFTVLAWVKWAGTNAETKQVVVGRGDDWSFGVNNDGGLEFQAPFTANLVKSPNNTLPTDQWKLVTATYDGRRAKLFIDDTEVADEQANGAFGTALSNLYIGASTTTTNSFNGIIDDVRIYNYSLSHAEIQAIYDAAPLAVEWMTPLTAVNRDNRVYLRWTVAQQVNNEKFEVEHSTDGIHFETIHTVAGDDILLHEKEFRAIHKNPVKGNNYYRIKQIDFDGTYEYSNIASVYIKQDDIVIYPNPAKDLLFINAKDRLIDRVVIYNQLGQVSLSLQTGNREIDVSALPKGIYTILILSKSNVYQKRLILE